MTTHNERGQERNFVRAVLPWLVAATAFIVYLITLNPWISFGNMPYVAKATGQSWSPDLVHPLLYLVTYPFRWLPTSWVPAALNLFSAVCASLTLALLARSVALLPHDRTHEQRLREHSEFSLLSIPAAWIPPVLAAAVCGLQASYWSNATSISGDMFELLLFAYVIRCLLEFRIAGRDSWLLRAALVYGAGMTGNWLMVGLLPVFIAAVLWIKGIGFFNLDFLGKMLLCGLAGLLFYLLLPLIYVLSDNATATFWEALKYNLVTQKNVLFLFARGIPKSLLLLLATTSLLPILLIGIRWASYFGDSSKLGIALTTWILHLAHAALLVVCIWVAFDPVFSPQHRGLVIPGLYYLGALSVGYFSGYFLLVFKPALDRMGRAPGGQLVLYRCSQAAIWVLAFLVPAGLVYKNTPQIKMTNGPALREFATLITRNLPDQGVILSDDAARLSLAEAWMAREGRADNYIFLDTEALAIPAYFDFQQRRHPKEWLPPVDATGTNRINNFTVLKLLATLSKKHPVYCLHPSFGYYFEFFYQQPHGLVMELKQYPTNVITAPPLTEAQIAENEKFWKDNGASIKSLLPFIQPPAPDQPRDFRQWFMNRLHIPFEPNPTASTLGSYYSQALNYWGVKLQRVGRLKEAAADFETALALNDRNVAAKSNLAVNQDLRAGRQPAMQTIRSFEEEFGKYRSWRQLLAQTGPFDDPTHCFIEGLSFARSALLREAVDKLERVHELVPDYLPATFWLARFYSNRRPEKSLNLIREIESRPQAMQNTGIRPLDLSLVKSVALFGTHDAPAAEEILHTVMQENPTNQPLLAVVAQISTMHGRFTNALAAVNQELRLKPDNPVALVAKGYLNLQMGHYEQAIPPLSRALSLNTNNQTARFDRAIAYLRCSKLDEAKQDYEVLQKVYPNAFQVYYGLGEIAWRKKDTNAAIHFYRLYMTNCIPGSDEAKTISNRLNDLTVATTPP